jgi:hypothetical protein
MADVIDNYVNITISITAEGGATITCSNCTQTVVTGATVTVNYTLTNSTPTSDTLFAQLWNIPGLTGGNMDQELYRAVVPGNGSVALSVQFVGVTAPISKSIRVGHVVG